MRGKLLAACFLMAFSGVSGAFAHAFVDHADPKVGGSVAESPKAVRVWFTEPLDPGACSIRVLDASGQSIDLGDAHVDAKNTSLLLAGLHLLKAGVYKVVWQVVSADGHKTEGDFKFQIAL